MRFDNAHDIETCVWQMRWNDLQSDRSRALVNLLFDGAPPYPAEDGQDHEVNVNYLGGSRIAHSAQRQLEAALFSPSQLFTVTVDRGPKWQRQEYGNDITRRINKIIKENTQYRRTEQDVIKQVILHGPGPSAWLHRQRWLPKMMGIGDVLLPTKTLVDLSNLNYFALSVQFTEEQLRRMTRGAHVDPGWNMPLVKQCLAWVKEQWHQSASVTENEALSREKATQLAKSNRGLFSDDATPTIDCWIFFYHSVRGRKWGWRRKIILDTPTTMTMGRSPDLGTAKSIVGTRGEFLYDSGSRLWAEHLGEIIHFLHGNVSTVAPSYYHAERSMGWLLYSLCHLQNRQFSAIDEATFESLMQYFWANGDRDVQRVADINLTHKKVLPEGLRFVLPQERWQVNEMLAQGSAARIQQLIGETASSYVQELSMGGGRDASETATKTMARVNASAALIGSLMSGMYEDQASQYREICRRFCLPDSEDPDVRRFRAQVLRNGMPEEVLDSECWDVQPVRVVGGGNITVQMAMTDKLMASVYDKLDPSSQQELKRLFIAVNSQDYALADRWVPTEVVPSRSVTNAQRDAAVLLAGLPVSLSEGVNHEEVIQVYLTDLGMTLKRMQAAGGPRDAGEIMGLQNLAGMTIQGQPFPDDSLKQSNVRTHLALFGQHRSPDTNAKTKQFEDALNQLMNLVKALAQQFAQKQAAGNGNGKPQMDPKDQAKIAGMMMEKRAKIALGAQSHAARTAQRDVQFQQQLKHDAIRQAADLAAKNLEVSNRSPLKGLNE